jgi:hypothetical protein
MLGRVKHQLLFLALRKMKEIMPLTVVRDISYVTVVWEESRVQTMINVETNAESLMHIAIPALVVFL